MLHSFNDLSRFSLAASDGDIGVMTDMLYHDGDWRVRHMVADIGGLLSARKVLLDPALVGPPDIAARATPVRLSVENVRAAPELDTDPPVSDQRRASAAARVPSVFLAPPDGAYSPMLVESMMMQASADQAAGDETGDADPHLRSMEEALGYAIRATDGEIGSVADFLVDPDGWTVAYLTVDTGRWLPGKQVVLNVDWIEGFSWGEGVVEVPFDRKTIEESPEVGSLDNLQRCELESLHAYYGYPMV